MKQFDSFDEAMAEVRRQRRVADGHMLLWQEQAGPGDYAVVFDDDAIVYAELLPFPDDFYPDPAPNTRWTRGFSAYEPDGEYGSIHAAAINGLITAEQFERARQAGWPADLNGFRRVVAGDPRWGAPTD